MRIAERAEAVERRIARRKARTAPPVEPLIEPAAPVELPLPHRPMTRMEKVLVAHWERDRGSTQDDTARLLGVSRSTIAAYINDPFLEKQIGRRVRYSGVCEACGGPTSGADGRDRAPKMCAPCRVKHPVRRKHTRESVIAAIQGYARIHGRPPASTDWLAPKVKVDALREADGIAYPYTPTVLVLFGSWRSAIEAAGLDPDQRHREYQSRARPPLGVS